MTNEIRNELLQILSIAKENKELKNNRQLDWLLESFERDINRKIEEIESEECQLKHNLEVLEYVRAELKKESD